MARFCRLEGTREVSEARLQMFNPKFRTIDNLWLSAYGLW
jgi:hypothetical protein